MCGTNRNQVLVNAYFDELKKVMATHNFVKKHSLERNTDKTGISFETWNQF
jgi:hypothetical protein